MKEIYKAQYAEAFGIDEVNGYAEPRDTVESWSELEYKGKADWDTLVDLQHAEQDHLELRRIKNELARRAIEGI